MRIPSASWEMTYANDRRKHNHRCMCCSKIIQAGETVLMCRQHKGTVAVHIACADRQHSPGNSWRDAFECWGGMHNRALGYKVPQHKMEIAH